MDEAANLFRERVAAMRAGRRRCSYPEELRAEALSYVEAARSRGVSFVHAAAALGVDRSNLRTWGARRRGAALRVVRVVDAVDAATAPIFIKANIVVHGPSGMRIEGLDVTSLATLMRSLS